LSLVIVALARPFQSSPDPARQVVAVVDCSAGMDDAAFEQAAAGLRKLAGLTRLVVFGADAREIALDGDLPTAGELGRDAFRRTGQRDCRGARSRRLAVPR
jgi:hypothetical protein